MIQFPTLPLYTLLFWLIINYLTPPPIIAGVPDGRTADESDEEKSPWKTRGPRPDPGTTVQYGYTPDRATGYLYYCSATATEYVVLQKVRVHSIICDTGGFVETET